MIETIQNFIRGADSAIASVYLSMFRERNALMTFLYHSLFRNEAEIALNHVDPLQRTTTTQFRQFIQYYLSHGYRFISPSDLLNGLRADGKYALITFDDGYYNNTLALPILQEFNVPATFFISTNHVLQNKSYWWDVHHRERIARAATRHQIYTEAVALKSLRADQLEEKLAAEFGPSAFRPKGDIDRPFSPAELKQFAASESSSRQPYRRSCDPDELRSGADSPAGAERPGNAAIHHRQDSRRDRLSQWRA